MGDGEEGEGRQHLVEPRDVEPKHLEAADVEHSDGNGKQRGCEQKALQERLLVVVTEVGHYHAGGSESAAASTHRGCHDAKHGKHQSRIAQPIVAHPLYQKARIHLDRTASSHGIIELLIRRSACHVEHIDELDGGSSPDEGYHSFRHHRSVEATKAVLLVLDATGHHGALRGMEAAYCSASYRDEEAWKEVRIADGIMVAEGFGYAGDVSFMRKDAETDENRHDEQSCTEDGIDGTYDFVNGKDGDGKVEDENEDRPDEVGIGNVEQPQRQLLHQSGRYQHEAGAHANHQDERHDTHHQPTRATQLIANDFGQAHSVATDAYHACHVVVHGSAQDAAQHNPQESRRAVEHAHHGAEDRPRAGDVEELHRIDFPRRHRDEVGAVGLRVARRLTVGTDAEHLLHKRAVNKIAKHQAGQSNAECNHLLYLPFNHLPFTIFPLKGVRGSFSP